MDKPIMIVVTRRSTHYRSLLNLRDIEEIQELTEGCKIFCYSEVIFEVKESFDQIIAGLERM